jgi:hypothetical protein
MAFKRLDPEDFVVSSDPITGPVWSTGYATLYPFYDAAYLSASSGIIVPTSSYYMTVYHDPNAIYEPQFSITYGDADGSGSKWYNSIVDHNSPTSTIYGQYRSMILEDENSNFVFGSGNNFVTSSNFWAISIDRARYKESLFPGSLKLTLTGSFGNKIVQLTDDSQSTLTTQYLGSTRVFQLISGSNGTPYVGSTNGGYTPSSGSYGLVFPDLGTIIFNPKALETVNIFAHRTSNSASLSIENLYNALGPFKLNSEETITSDYVFVRARNSEFNYSANSSFISGSTGEVIYNNFINHPQVYVTTVGLYNDSNELLAVAKLSKPLLKDFTKESLLRVKLSY